MELSPDNCVNRVCAIMSRLAKAHRLTLGFRSPDQRNPNQEKRMGSIEVTVHSEIIQDLPILFFESVRASRHQGQVLHGAMAMSNHIHQISTDTTGERNEDGSFGNDRTTHHLVGVHQPPWRPGIPLSSPGLRRQTRSLSIHPPSTPQQVLSTAADTAQTPAPFRPSHQATRPFLRSR